MVGRLSNESWERFFDSSPIETDRNAQLSISKQRLSDLRAIVNALKLTRKGIAGGGLKPIATNIGELDSKISGYQNMIEQLVGETRETIIDYNPSIDEIRNLENPLDFRSSEEWERELKLRRF